MCFNRKMVFDKEAHLFNNSRHISRLSKKEIIFGIFLENRPILKNVL